MGIILVQNKKKVFQAEKHEELFTTKYIPYCFLGKHQNLKALNNSQPRLGVASGKAGESKALSE